MIYNITPINAIIINSWPYPLLFNISEGLNKVFNVKYLRKSNELDNLTNKLITKNIIGNPPPISSEFLDVLNMHDEQKQIELMAK